MRIIKQLRKEAGMKQSELAKILNVGQSTVSGWENGTFEPDRKTLRKIANLFNVSTDYLIGNTNIKNPLTSEDISGLTEKQIKILEMMDKLPEQDQDDLIQQAEYRIWLKHQKESGR